MTKRQIKSNEIKYNLNNRKESSYDIKAKI